MLMVNVRVPFDVFMIEAMLVHFLKLKDIMKMMLKMIQMIEIIRKMKFFIRDKIFNGAIFFGKQIDFFDFFQSHRNESE